MGLVIHVVMTAPLARSLQTIRKHVEEENSHAQTVWALPRNNSHAQTEKNSHAQTVWAEKNSHAQTQKNPHAQTRQYASQETPLAGNTTVWNGVRLDQTHLQSGRTSDWNARDAVVDVTFVTSVAIIAAFHETRVIQHTRFSNVFDMCAPMTKPHCGLQSTCEVRILRTNSSRR